MNRRDVIKSVGALAGVSLATGAFGSNITSGHHAGSGILSNLTVSLAECIAWCEKCEEHCIQMFAQGRTEFAKTLARVRECAEMCKAMLTYSTSDSTLRFDVAKVCAQVCRECGDACSVHAAESEICKACAAACYHCAELCESYR